MDKECAIESCFVDESTKVATKDRECEDLVKV